MYLAIFIFLLLELILVSVVDFYSKKIHNFWPIFNIIFFLSLSWLFPKEYFYHWNTFLIPISWIIAGFFLFTLRIMGAGDSKFVATFYLIVPFAFKHDSFLYLLVATIVIGGTMMLLNFIKNRKALLVAFVTKDLRVINIIFGKKFPFAPVVLISWIILGINTNMLRVLK